MNKDNMKAWIKKWKLDEEEVEFLRSFERGEWKLVPNQAKRKKEAQASARYTLAQLKKNKNINIRVSEGILNKLKAKAMEEGLPYQTLIGSILHKYVNGTLGGTTG